MGMTSPAERRAQLRAELEEIERQERAAAAERAKAADAAWKALPRVFKAKPYRYRTFDNGPIEGAFVSKHVEPEALAAFTLKYGERSPDAWDRDGAGMFYYRTEENILTHEGGGTNVLDTPRLCSDAEWAQILSGDVPAKFHRRQR